ncbi:protein kinase [Endozoicomonas sp. ONNA2]|uniref:protein kinase domain-containing protein n=1 Tax=Endozoicomonas sp. ONNA2 TaxID=2828741 RepID=UPI002147AFD3|nr:protein kinase [Endozoicomonas sp. ONNA2]
MTTGYVQPQQLRDTSSLTTDNSNEKQGTFAARTAQGIANPAFTPSGSSWDHGNVSIVHRAVDVVPEESGHVLPFNYRKIKILVKNTVKKKLVGQGCFGKVFRAVQVPPKGAGSKKMSRFYVVKDNDSLLCSFATNEKKCLKAMGEFIYSPWYRRNRLVMHDKGANLEMLFDLFKREDLLLPATRKGIPGHMKCSIARQLFQSLQKVHEKGILHSDIKPQNITINSKGEVSLIDYGIAVKRNRKGQFKLLTRSPDYSAPETFDMETATEKADIWSLGLTLAEMELGYRHSIIKEKPLKLTAYERILVKLKPDLKKAFVKYELDTSAYNKLIIQIKRRPGISEDWRNVLLGCLQLDPDKRPSAGQLLTYPYLRQQKLDEMGHMDLYIAHQNAFKALVEAEKAIEKKGKCNSDAEMKKLTDDLAQCQGKVQKIQSLIREKEEQEKELILQEKELIFLQEKELVLEKRRLAALREELQKYSAAMLLG